MKKRKSLKEEGEGGGGEGFSFGGSSELGTPPTRALGILSTAYGKVKATKAKDNDTLLRDVRKLRKRITGKK